MSVQIDDDESELDYGSDLFFGDKQGIS